MGENRNDVLKMYFCRISEEKQRGAWIDYRRVKRFSGLQKGESRFIPEGKWSPNTGFEKLLERREKSSEEKIEASG